MRGEGGGGGVGGGGGGVGQGGIVGEVDTHEGMRKGHFRESGLWSREWQREMERAGMRRGVVEKVVRCLQEGIDQLEAQVWQVRE